eukprot:jgi/Ulvmu1/7422/UM036_0083.1
MRTLACSTIVRILTVSSMIGYGDEYCSYQACRPAEALASTTGSHRGMSLGAAVALSLGLGPGSVITTGRDHDYCMLRHPILQQLWDAALAGDAATVRAMLTQHSIAPSTRHHVCGSELLLDIAEAPAATEAADRRLCRVLGVLLEAGWPLQVHSARTGENALHLLSAQPPHAHVRHRLRVLLEEAAAGGAEGVCVLAAEDLGGRTPEQRLAELRPEAAQEVRAARLRAQRACAAA